MSTYPSITHSKPFRIISTLVVGVIFFLIGYTVSNTSLSSKIFTDIDNTPSVVDGIQKTILTPTAESAEQKPYTMLFFGDMMFDRGVATHIRKRGGDYVFASGTKALTQDYDLVIANLEGPITSHTSRTIDANGKAIPGFSFTFPTSTAVLLNESGIDIVSLANNHADNFGREGLTQTIQYLGDAGVQYFGNPTNSLFDIASSSYVHCPLPSRSADSTNPSCIAFIGYHQFTYKNEAHILAEVVRYEADPRIAFTVVFPHWGEEYQKVPNQNQISLAHQWVDSGADLIIGAHPHVVQSIEVYKDTYIYYSLGNYIFDQYFSYDTTHGIAVGITLTPDLQQVQSTEVIPIDITGTIVRKANDTDAKKILDDIKRMHQSTTTSTSTSTSTNSTTVR